MCWRLSIWSSCKDKFWCLEGLVLCLPTSGSGDIFVFPWSSVRLKIVSALQLENRSSRYPHGMS